MVYISTVSIWNDAFTNCRKNYTQWSAYISIQWSAYISIQWSAYISIQWSAYISIQGSAFYVKRDLVEPDGRGSSTSFQLEPWRTRELVELYLQGLASSGYSLYLLRDQASRIYIQFLLRGGGRGGRIISTPFCRYGLRLFKFSDFSKNSLYICKSYGLAIS